MDAEFRNRKFNSFCLFMHVLSEKFFVSICSCFSLYFKLDCSFFFALFYPKKKDYLGVLMGSGETLSVTKIYCDNLHQLNTLEFSRK